MSKIGKKIMQSYIVIILATAFIFMVIAKMSFNDILNRQTRLDLKEDADAVAKQINMVIDQKIEMAVVEGSSNTKIQISKNFFQEDVLNISEIILPQSMGYAPNRFATTHFIIMDADQNLIFQSYNTDQESIDPLAIDKTKYYVEQRPLTSSLSKETLGYLVMLAKKEDLSLINALIDRSVFLGFLIALFIAGIISLFFERGIISPINKVKKNIASFSFTDDEIIWEEIKTKDELSEINQDFLKMVYKLKEYDKSQKEFFQNTSHELKTPLMSIQGYAEAIKDGVMDESMVDEGLDIIIDESKKLRDTVNSIVYLSKMENSMAEERIVRINLWEAVEEITIKLMLLAKENNITFKNDIDHYIVVRTSEDMLDKVFSNIISNALRYAKSQISIDSFESETGHIIIKIQDDGRGFENNEEQHIFDRFYKGTGGNTGLGLSIAKSIAEINGWGIKAYNADEGGAVVEIVIPPFMDKDIN